MPIRFLLMLVRLFVAFYQFIDHCLIFYFCVSPLGRVAGRGLSLRLMGQRELVLGNLLASSLLYLTSPAFHLWLLYDF